MKALEKAKTSLKADGISHLKAELEAQLGRQQRRIRWNCDDCNGQRMSYCQHCSGLGIRTVNKFAVECNHCNGTGSGSSCSTCNGSGNRGDFSDTYVCQMYIIEYMTKALYGKTISQLEAEGKTLGERQYNGGQSGGTMLPWVNYIKFYLDGSVDSECTITFPVEYAEHAKLILDAFKSLALLASENHIDVRGSGMHLAALPEGCEGLYPSPHRLNVAGLRNFTQQVTKLLPALYFVATSNNRSRSTYYRNPRISNNEKYSAVFTNGGRVFEFRVFETCYDRPDAIFEFIEVMAKALRFYGDPSLKVKSLGKKFGFPNSTQIAHYYDTAEQLRILNATVKYLKPEDKSFKRMKQERGVKQTIKSLALKERSRMATLKSDYDQYKKHWTYVRDRPVSAAEQRNIDYLILDDGMTDEQARECVLRGRQGRLVSFADFLRNNITARRTSKTVNV